MAENPQTYIGGPNDPTAGTNIRPVEKRSSSEFFQEPAKEAIQFVGQEAAVAKFKGEAEDIREEGQRSTDAMDALNQQIAERQQELASARAPIATGGTDVEQGLSQITQVISQNEDEIISLAQREIQKIRSGEKQGMIPPEAVDARILSVGRKYINRFPFASQRLKSVLDTSLGDTSGSDLSGRALSGQKSFQQKEMERAESELNTIMIDWGVSPQNLYDPTTRQVFQNQMKNEAMRKILKAGNTDALTIAEHTTELRLDVDSIIGTQLSNISKLMLEQGYTDTTQLPPDILAKAQADIEMIQLEMERKAAEKGARALLGREDIDNYVQDQVTRPFEGLKAALSSQNLRKIKEDILAIKKADFESEIYNNPAMLDVMRINHVTGGQPLQYMSLLNEIVMKSMKATAGGGKEIDPVQLRYNLSFHPGMEGHIRSLANGDDSPLLKIIDASREDVSELIKTDEQAAAAAIAYATSDASKRRRNRREASEGEVDFQDNLDEGAAVALAYSADRTINAVPALYNKPGIQSRLAENPEAVTAMHEGMLYGSNGLLNSVREEFPDGLQVSLMSSSEAASALGIDPSEMPNGTWIVAMDSRGVPRGITTTNREGRGTFGGRVARGSSISTELVPRVPSLNMSSRLINGIADHYWFMERYGSNIDTSRGSPGTSDEFFQMFDFQSQITESGQGVSEEENAEIDAQISELDRINNDPDLATFIGGHEDGTYQTASGRLITISGGKVVSME